MTARGELFQRIAEAFAELARLEVEEAPLVPLAKPMKRRPPVRPLQVCDAGPVDELSRARAAKALARYR